MPYSSGWNTRTTTFFRLSGACLSLHFTIYRSVRCIEGRVRIDRAVRYPVPKRDIEETKIETENDVAEAAAQLRSITRPKRPGERAEEVSAEWFPAEFKMCG